MIEEKIFRYIYEELEKQKILSENETRGFLEYVGLDRENIRQMLMVENPRGSLSEQNYQWADLYGKNQTLDLTRYIVECNAMFREKLRNKRDELLECINESLIPAISGLGNVYLVLQLLERGNENGLYGILKKECIYDDSHLRTINDHTFDVIQSQDIAALNERRGIFGKREERVADLLASVDSFVRQNYEILRYEIMSEVYQSVLGGLEKYWIEFPEGTLSSEVRSVLEKSQVILVFERAYLEKLDIPFALKKSAEFVDIKIV